MRIKKNGKVINLTEGDLKKIVRKVLIESDSQRIVKNILKEQGSLPRETPSDRTGRGGDFQPLKYIEDVKFRDDKPKKVLFVGDSQTANSWSYANQLIKSGLLDPKSVNKAIGGKGTGEFMKQLDGAINSLGTDEKFDIINIMGGGNNSGYQGGGEEAKKNLQLLYNKAKKYGATVVAISNPNKDWTNKDITVKKRNNSISKFVNNNPPNTDIVINASKFKVNAYEKDRIHLNSRANSILKTYWVNNVL